MHFPEGLFEFRYAALWSVLAFLFLLDSFRQTQKIFRRGSSEEKALLGLLGILIFAVTFIPVPVPFGAGLCLHICATPLVALILGPRLVVLPTFVSLMAQVFLFGHGGLTTLGASLMSFGVVAPWICYLVTRVLAWFKIPLFPAVFVGVLGGVMVSAILDAGLFTLSLYGWVAFKFWIPKTLTGVLSLRVPFAILESVMSALVLRGLMLRRAYLLPEYLRIRFKKVSVV